jgi:RNA polymerase sigma-70 factor (ECF subfamily)
MLDPGAISALHEAAARAWPGVHVSLDAFSAHVESLGVADPESIVAEDLYLALACGSGDSAAIAAFEEQRFTDVRRALARLRIDGAAADDIVQRVRTKLLVGDGGPARILAYGGRGSLAAWLRAVCVHEALTTMRAEKRRGPHDGPSAIERMAAPEEPELAELRARYAVPFKEAFAGALAALAPRDRNVLRLVYVEGLTAEQVGLAYGVHRVSVARWLASIRESLFEQTRRAVGQKLALGAAEFASVTRLCLSQMDVSLERLLEDM